MATYKAVMRPALEYASSIWSPLASSTSINKLQVMQNAALRTATQIITFLQIMFTHSQCYHTTPVQLNTTRLLLDLWTDPVGAASLLSILANYNGGVQ